MKTLRFLGVALVAVVLSAGFCACSDDDDLSSSPSENSAVITIDNNGDMVLLKSIKSGSSTPLSFNYDAQGRCTAIYSYGYQNCAISYDPYRMTYWDDEEDITLSLSFDGSYLAKIVVQESWEDRYSSGSENGTINLSYDSNGCLTKITQSYSGSEIEDGDKYTWSGSLTTTLSWSGGDLIKLTNSGSEKEDGEVYKWNDVCTFNYYDTENEYRQYTMALADIYEIAELDDLGFIGYYGNGPVHLLKSYTCEWDDDDDGYKDSGEYSQSFSYGSLNSNGTINTETVGSRTTYTYSYTTVDSDTRSAVSTFEDAFATPWNDNNVERKPMFGRHSKRHSRHEKAELQ